MTLTSTVLLPRFSASAPVGDPDVTDTYELEFTRASIVALEAELVGVTVIDPVAFNTSTV